MHVEQSHCRFDQNRTKNKKGIDFGKFHFFFFLWGGGGGEGGGGDGAGRRHFKYLLRLCNATELKLKK